MREKIECLYCGGYYNWRAHGNNCPYCVECAICGHVFAWSKYNGECPKCEKQNSPDAKHDAGKPRISLVPRQIIRDIAAVREFGNKKYSDPDSWKTVAPERYRNAMLRHLLDYLDNPEGVDAESGLKHLSHLACNVAFLCEMEGGKNHG